MTIKKIIVSLILAVAMLCIPMFVISPAQAAPITLNLRAVWTANTEVDITGYKIYHAQLDNPTTYNFWNGTSFNSSQCTNQIDVTTEGTALTLSPLLLNFVSLPIQDSYPRIGVMNFALKAFDSNLLYSAKATAVYNYNVNTTPPIAPVGFSVIKP